MGPSAAPSLTGCSDTGTRQRCSLRFNPPLRGVLPVRGTLHQRSESTAVENPRGQCAKLPNARAGGGTYGNVLAHSVHPGEVGSHEESQSGI